MQVLATLDIYALLSVFHLFKLTKDYIIIL